MDDARHRLAALADRAAQVVAAAVEAGDARLALQVLKMLGVAQTPGRATRTPVTPSDGEAVDTLHAEAAEEDDSHLKSEISNADVDRRAIETGARCATAAAATASDLKFEISNADADRRASETDARCAEAAAVDHAADSEAAANASDLKPEISNADAGQPGSEAGARCTEASVDHAADAEVGQPVGAAELARDDAKSASPATEDASTAPAVVTISATNAAPSGPSPEQLELLRWRRMPFEQRSRRIEARMRELQAQINLARHGAGCANVAAAG